MDSPVAMFFALLGLFAAPALPCLLLLYFRVRRLRRSTKELWLLLPITLVVWLVAAIATGWQKGGSNIAELFWIGCFAGIGALARLIALRQPNTSFTTKYMVIGVSIAAGPGRPGGHARR